MKERDAKGRWQSQEATIRLHLRMLQRYGAHWGQMHTVTKLTLQEYARLMSQAALKFKRPKLDVMSMLSDCWEIHKEGHTDKEWIELTKLLYPTLQEVRHRYALAEEGSFEDDDWTCAVKYVEDLCVDWRDFPEDEKEFLAHFLSIPGSIGEPIKSYADALKAEKGDKK